MPERLWNGLIVTTEEAEATRDEPSTGRIVKVELDDAFEFVESFPDEAVLALDLIARSVLLENEDAFWSESEEVEADD